MTWHTLIDAESSARLCLTLFHSLWQVGLLAAIAWTLGRLWRRQPRAACCARSRRFPRLRFGLVLWNLPMRLTRRGTRRILESASSAIVGEER